MSVLEGAKKVLLMKIVHIMSHVFILPVSRKHVINCVVDLVPASCS